MNMCMFISESNFKEDGFNSNILMTMSDTQEDSSYTLDFTSMWTAQLNGEGLISIVGRYIISSGKDDTIYTCKCVKRIELIHKNNRILFPNQTSRGI